MIIVDIIIASLLIGIFVWIVISNHDDHNTPAI